MAIPPEFLDELKLRLPAPDVVGKKVHLKRSGRDLKGLCPFHKEKTPSFHCYDDHYHCFGCGEHGSIIDFAMKLENLDFREAVTQLAGQAGMSLPEERPEDADRRARATSLLDVVERATRQFERWLHLPEGRGALAYLEGRGLTPETIRHFRLGFAPDGRGLLKAALAKDGVEEGQMLEAGLVVQPEDGREAYDRFRGRVIFPIADRQGRVIAFGARLLEGGAPNRKAPKYLNSPETPLFHKSRNLYGLKDAAPAVRDKGTVLVAEGYMDVIALHQAGFENAVAPLGTALTEEHLKILWRVTPEPVLCLDGDAAGQRAAARAAERALPLLQAGAGLRFALLPKGEDPDSLLRAEGPAAIGKLVDQALPLSELIWRLETEGREAATPEGRAALERRITDRLRQIEDPTVRAHFSDAFKGRLRPARPSARGGPWTGRGKRFVPDDDPAAKRLVAGGADVAALDAARLQEVILLATVIAHPHLLDETDEEVGQVSFTDAALDEARQAILIAHAGAETLDRSGLEAHLSEHGFGSVLKLAAAVRRDHAHFIRDDAPPHEIRRGFRETLERLRGKDLEGELQAAREAIRLNPDDEDALRRVAHIQRLITNARDASQADPQTEYPGVPAHS